VDLIDPSSLDIRFIAFKEIRNGDLSGDAKPSSGVNLKQRPDAEPAHRCGGMLAKTRPPTWHARCMDTPPHREVAMRYVVVCVLAMVLSAPLSASAQDEGTTPNLGEPQSEPAQEAPALQLDLDVAGVDVVASSARTVDGYTLKAMERRVQRAKRGLGASVVPFVVGGILMTVGGISYDRFWTSTAPKSCDRMLYAGVGLTVVGAAGMIATGILLGVRKGKLRTLREAASYEGRRRAQWDVERSRLVF